MEGLLIVQGGPNKLAHFVLYALTLLDQFSKLLLPCEMSATIESKTTSVATHFKSALSSQQKGGHIEHLM